MHFALIIDCDKVISPNINILQNLPPIPPLTQKDYKLGLILVINKQNYEQLTNANYGEERIKILSSIQSVFSSYIFYNEKKGICVLNYNIDFISEILEAFFTTLPPNILLWVSIPLNKDIKLFVQNGFNSPYITTLTPLQTSIEPSIALIKRNIKKEEIKATLTSNKIAHLIQEYNKNKEGCSLFAKFSNKAIAFLKTTSKKGITINKDGTKSQKELTGELEIEDVIQENNKIIYIIDVNKSSVSSGEEEEVNVSATRYNFHSHPEEAYVRHSVSKAWPSLTDYLGYLKLGKNTIFHCVATLEGIYIINFGEYWGNRLNKIDKKFIKKHYDIDHKRNYTPTEYIEKVNKILYKGYSIYNLHFLAWYEANKIFQVHFPVISNSCLVSQEIVDNHKKIHG